jgi:hypothetical protein
MKKLLVLTLVGLMAFSGFTFAEISNQEVENQEQGILKERQEKAPKPTDPQARKEVYRDRLTELMLEYNVDLLDDFQEAWGVHDEIHVVLEAHREEVLNALKAEKEAYKEKLDAGEMTKDEIKAEVFEKRTEHQAKRALINEEIEALKKAFGIHEGMGKELHGTLKLAVDEGNFEEIYNALEDILQGLKVHTSFDQEKYQLMLNY